MRLVYGTDSCDWLLARGEYHADAWQPYGCMVHTYTVRDSRRCMKYLEFLGQRNRLAFVGDSRVRQLYAAFVTQFGETVPPAEGERRHQDLAYADAQLGLHVQFLWRPMVDARMQGDIIEWRDSAPEGLPRVLVLGSATHAIKTFNGSAEALLAYERNVTRLGAVLDQLAGAGVRVLWTIQEPVFYDRLAEWRRAITNQQVSVPHAAASADGPDCVCLKLIDLYCIIGVIAVLTLASVSLKMYMTVQWRGRGTNWYLVFCS